MAFEDRLLTSLTGVSSNPYVTFEYFEVGVEGT
jgi:hypothetical protein